MHQPTRPFPRQDQSKSCTNSTEAILANYIRRSRFGLLNNRIIVTNFVIPVSVICQSDLRQPRALSRQMVGADQRLRADITVVRQDLPLLTSRHFIQWLSILTSNLAAIGAIPSLMGQNASFRSRCREPCPGAVFQFTSGSSTGNGQVHPDKRTDFQ